MHHPGWILLIYLNPRSLHFQKHLRCVYVLKGKCQWGLDLSLIRFCFYSFGKYKSALSPALGISAKRKSLFTYCLCVLCWLWWGNINSTVLRVLHMSRYKDYPQAVASTLNFTLLPLLPYVSILFPIHRKCRQMTRSVYRIFCRLLWHTVLKTLGSKSLRSLSIIYWWYYLFLLSKFNKLLKWQIILNADYSHILYIILYKTFII